MGSFLNQCCISNQIIENGYLIPILVKKEYSTVKLKNKDGTTSTERPIKQSVYAQDTFLPVGFMFEGKHSDCGRYDIDWDKNLEMFKCFIKFLQENSLITSKGENEYHEKAFNPIKEYSLHSITLKNAQNVFDNLQEKINKGRVFINSYGNCFLELKFAIIEKIAGNEVESNGIQYLSKKENLYFVNKEQKEEYINRLTASPEEVLSALTDFLKESQIKTDEVKQYIDQLVENKIKPNPEDYKTLRILTEKLSFKYFLKDEHSIYIFDLLDYLLSENRPFSLNTIRLLRKLKGIIQGLNIINMGLKPVIYGSQDYSNETGQMFSKIMSEIATKYENEYGLDEDDC